MKKLATSEWNFISLRIRWKRDFYCTGNMLLASPSIQDVSKNCNVKQNVQRKIFSCVRCKNSSSARFPRRVVMRCTFIRIFIYFFSRFSRISFFRWFDDFTHPYTRSCDRFEIKRRRCPSYTSTQCVFFYSAVSSLKFLFFPFDSPAIFFRFGYRCNSVSQEARR